jgi:hypothetical protein
LPVTFGSIAAFSGFVSSKASPTLAEEVAAVDPNLVAFDKNGRIETVRYTAVNATPQDVDNRLGCH